MSREDNFCNETNCSKYYNCSEGTCEEDTESCTLPPAGTCTATADTNNTCKLIHLKKYIYFFICMIIFICINIINYEKKLYYN